MDPETRSREIIETYDSIAGRYADRYDSDSSDNNLLDIFIKQIENPTARVLDLGSGTGRTSAYINGKRPEYSLLGIDLSDGMLEIARKNFPSLEFQKNDIKTFDMPGESFDAVIAQSSLFHLDKEELARLARKIHSALKPGGVWGVLMQIVDGYRCVSLPEPLMPELIMHLCFYGEKDLEDIFVETGFKIIQKEKNDIPGGKISSHKLLIVGQK